MNNTALGFTRTPQAIAPGEEIPFNPFWFLTDPENAPEPIYCQGTGCGPGAPPEQPRTPNAAAWIKENSGLILAGAAGVFVLAMIAGGRRR